MGLSIAHINPNFSGASMAKLLKKVSAADRFAYEMEVKGWQRSLKKHAAEIAEIQAYFPGWAPEF